MVQKATQPDTSTLPLDSDHAIEPDEWNDDEEDDDIEEELTQSHATEHKTRYKSTKDMVDVSIKPFFHIWKSICRQCCRTMP